MTERRLLKLMNSDQKVIYQFESKWDMTAMKFLMSIYSAGEYTIHLDGAEPETYKVQVIGNGWVFDNGDGDILSLTSNEVKYGKFRYRGTIVGVIDGDNYQEFIQSLPGLEIWYSGWHTLEPVFESVIQRV